MSRKRPSILIIGRPNVGKSTFINRIIGKNKAITYDEPGVTRDIVSYTASWNGVEIDVMDSGGLVLNAKTSTEIQKSIDALVMKAIPFVDKLLLLVDGKSGLTPMDKDISRALRPYQEKLILLVNKVDNWGNQSGIQEFYTLGLGKPYPVSALHGSGIGDVLDIVLDGVESLSASPSSDQETYKIAIVGRPNVGKSSLLNALINDNLVLVSDEAGTTRDAIEIGFQAHGKRFSFIDTAGLRRRVKVTGAVEFYSTVRTQKAIKEADIVIFVTEPTEFLCDQDRKIINMILGERRNMIIWMNKWDITDKTSFKRDEYLDYMLHEFPQLEYYPFMVGSALERSHLGKFFQMIPEVIQNSRKRIKTSELNTYIRYVLDHYPPPSKKGKHMNLLFSTQAETSPPIFIFFVNNPQLAGDDYRRFIERRLRTDLDPFLGVPVQVFFKKRQSNTK